MQKLPTPEDKHEEKAIADIEKHGVHVLNVFDPDGNDPKFNYSVGLWHSYEHPEILIFGLDAEISTQLINDIADKCRACLLYTSPSPRDQRGSRMPSSA